MADSKNISSPSSGGCFLSKDVLEEIFIKVPMKTLYRFRCVYKSWQSLISDPLFITRYKALTAFMLGVFYYNIKNKKPYYYSYFLEDRRYPAVAVNVEFYDFNTKQVINGFLSFLQLSITVVASHNGFILCAVNEGSNCKPFTYLVCNPLTKGFVYFPRPRTIHYLHTVFLVCTTTPTDHQYVEFEVISTIKWADDDQWKLDIYSSHTRKWRKKSSIFHLPVS